MEELHKDMEEEDALKQQQLQEKSWRAGKVQKTHTSVRWRGSIVFPVLAQKKPEHRSVHLLL